MITLNGRNVVELEVLDDEPELGIIFDDHRTNPSVSYKLAVDIKGEIYSLKKYWREEGEEMFLLRKYIVSGWSPNQLVNYIIVLK